MARDGKGEGFARAEIECSLHAHFVLDMHARTFRTCSRIYLDDPHLEFPRTPYGTHARKVAIGKGAGNS